MLAVFSDLDGTLSEGFITADFVRYLNKKNLISKSAFNIHEDLLKAHHDGKIAYIDLVPKWAASVALCFKDKKVSFLKKEADTFFKEWKKEKLFKSSKPLVSLFKKNNYKFFLISAGWDYTLSLVTKELGADESKGIKFEEKEGSYIGITKSDMPTRAGKVRAILELMKKYSLLKEDLIGIGDSIQDTAIFDLVKTSIALNPSNELKTLAKEKQWMIETKDTVLNSTVVLLG